MQLAVTTDSIRVVAAVYMPQIQGRGGNLEGAVVVFIL